MQHDLAVQAFAAWSVALVLNLAVKQAYLSVVSILSDQNKNERHTFRWRKLFDQMISVDGFVHAEISRLSPVRVYIFTFYVFFCISSV